MFFLPWIESGKEILEFSEAGSKLKILRGRTGFFLWDESNCSGESDKRGTHNSDPNIILKMILIPK